MILASFYDLRYGFSMEDLKTSFSTSKKVTEEMILKDARLDEPKKASETEEFEIELPKSDGRPRHQLILVHNCMHRFQDKECTISLLWHTMQKIARLLLQGKCLTSLQLLLFYLCLPPIQHRSPSGQKSCLCMLPWGLWALESWQSSFLRCATATSKEK